MRVGSIELNLEHIVSDQFMDLSSEDQSILLLDYVKGRSSSEMATQIEEAATQDVRLAEELAYYRGLARSVDATSGNKPVDEVAWARISEAIGQQDDRIPAAANDNSRRWQYVAAVLALVVVGQTGLMLNKPLPTDAQYAPVEEATGFVGLQVTFAAGVTEQQMRTLVQEVGGEFSGGPGALGVYEVRFPNEEARKLAYDRFSQAPSLIDSVFEIAN